jgi:hypothetical protein
MSISHFPIITEKRGHDEIEGELRSGFANPALDVDTKVRVLTAYYSIQEIYNDKKEEVLGYQISS